MNSSIVDHWPEIFADVDFSAIPVFYLHSVMISFKDGNNWEVVLKKEDKESLSGGLPKNLFELFQNYQDEITNVDFRLDIEKIKKDVIKTTNKFMKRKK